MNGYTIKYIYDDNNLLLGFIYNNETYYYQRTLTGEITRIVNSNGIIVGEYYYDAYGNILNLDELSEIAEINPFRYKGYYYDQETNLYYCKSRYYSPEIYRWISRDEIEYLDTSSITGCNLYVYCNNNPIMYVDENGNIAGWVIGLIVAAVFLIVNTSLEIEVSSAKSKYIENIVDIDFVEDDIKFNENNEVKIKDNTIGKIESEGNYIIYNSYLYNEEDMLVISKVIAKHMGDESSANRLFNEWQAHNYGYYAFNSFGICGLANWGYGLVQGASLVDSCKDVNFGINEETGIRGLVLDMLNWYAIKPNFKPIMF